MPKHVRVTMKVILCDNKQPIIDRWKKDFSDTPVKIHTDNIFDLEVDAIVSPANSFGFMDGGFDYALSEFFGWDLQETIKEYIHKLPMGELLVGQAVAFATGNDQIPNLIGAPTMRVPMNFNIPSSVNAYLATKAALLAAKEYVTINSVVITGMCTGVGAMPVDIASKQMRVAYAETIEGKKPCHKDFHAAQMHQYELNHLGRIYS